jgi:hypothetical protein
MRISTRCLVLGILMTAVALPSWAVPSGCWYWCGPGAPCDQVCMDENSAWITCAQSIYGCGNAGLASVRSGQAVAEPALSKERFLRSLEAEASSPASIRLALLAGH